MNHDEMIREMEIKVSDFFNGDTEKATAWFTTKNPNLGAVSPVEMIRFGHGEKLLEWINQQLDMNPPSDEAAQ